MPTATFPQPTQLIRLRWKGATTPYYLGITADPQPSVTLQVASQPGDATWDSQVWELVPTPYGYMGFKAAKGTRELYLDGHTLDGSVAVAPSMQYPYTGTAWENVSGVGDGAQFDCRGQLPQPAYVRLAGNGLGPVSLVSDAPTANTGWAMEIVPFLNYPCPDYAALQVEPQVTGWPLSDAEALHITDQPNAWTPSSRAFVPTTPRPQNLGNAAVYHDSVAYSHGNLYVVWYRNMLEHVRNIPRSVDIALIGDSITMQWCGTIWTPSPGLPLIPPWTDAFGQYTAVNLGYGGDTTEALLWRLDHGLLDAGTAQPLQPRLVVLLIGTNDVFLMQADLKQDLTQAAGWIANGVELCVKNISQRCPQAQIVLVQVLPRYDLDGADTYGAAVRTQVVALGITGRYPNVSLLDLSSSFPSSQAATLFLSDRLHLSADGYEAYAQGLSATIHSLLGSSG